MGGKNPTKMILFQAVSKARWREKWWWSSEMTTKMKKMQSDLGLTGGCLCLETQDPLGPPALIYFLHHLLEWHCILGGKSQNILRENIERDPNETILKEASCERSLCSRIVSSYYWDKCHISSFYLQRVFFFSPLTSIAFIQTSVSVWSFSQESFGNKADLKLLHHVTSCLPSLPLKNPIYFLC